MYYSGNVLKEYWHDWGENGFSTAYIIDGIILFFGGWIVYALFRGISKVIFYLRKISDKLE